jgi:4-amino-4-deoxy-L-arabinose transferase-like glycosyltransferase
LTQATDTTNAGSVPIRRERTVVFLAAFAIALFVVLVVWRLQGLVDNRPDPYWFSAMGRSVARGDGFSEYGVLLHRRSPLYPLTIGALYWLFGEREFVIQLLHILCFAGTTLLAYDLGRRLFNLRTARIAALFCAVHPSLLRYVPDFHLETMFTFLLTLSVWQTVRVFQRPTPLGGALLGVVFGLATLTKAVVLLFPVVVAALFAFSVLRKRARELRSAVIVPLGIAFVTMFLTISPWTIRNYIATGGHFVLVTTGGSDAFLRGYVFSKPDYALLRRPPYTDGENESNAMFNEICRKAGAVWEADDYQTDKILNAAAKERLLADPGAFVKKSVTGLFTFWYEMTTLKTSLVAGLSALAAWLLAIPGLVRSRREGRPVWLLLAPVVYLNLLLAMLLALGRYSVPVLPCLLIVSAFGADTLLTRFSTRRAAAR